MSDTDTVRGIPQKMSSQWMGVNILHIVIIYCNAIHKSTPSALSVIQMLYNADYCVDHQAVLRVRYDSNCVCLMDATLLRMLFCLIEDVVLSLMSLILRVLFGLFGDCENGVFNQERYFVDVVCLMKGILQMLFCVSGGTVLFLFSEMDTEDAVKTQFADASSIHMLT